MCKAEGRILISQLLLLLLPTGKYISFYNFNPNAFHTFFFTVRSLSCYQCVSTQPGCGPELDNRWQWSWTCERSDDKCVKVIERKGGEL